jgi:hypothetical protein
MGIVFNLGDEPEEVRPGERITFGKLDFIADQFGDLHLQECEPNKQEEEPSLQIRAFATGLEEAVDAGPHAIGDHLARYDQLFAKAGQERELDATFHICKVTDLVPVIEPTPIPYQSSSRFLGRSKQVMATHHTRLP